jgi:hypothetical protein
LPLDRFIYICYYISRTLKKGDEMKTYLMVIISVLAVSMVLGVILNLDLWPAASLSLILGNLIAIPIAQIREGERG